MSMNVSHNYACKVVSKVNRKSLRELMSQTAIVDTVVSPAEVTAERILVYVRAMKNADGLPVKTLHHLVSGQVDAMEFNVTESLPVIGVPLKDLPLKSGILLAAIVRQSGEIVIPSGNDTLQAGDDVIIVTTDTALNDLRDILR
jgi:trk system potassium uptake protein TrkA